MEPLIILGAGTMAQEVTDLASDIGGYEIIGYAVDRGWREGQELLGRPVIRFEDLALTVPYAWLVGAMFWPERRAFIERVEAMWPRWASLVHPSASVSRTARIGPGTVINRLVAVGAYASIGRHCLINRGALIGHHVEIGDFATMGPGANLAGRVKIGAGALVGMGAIVREGRSIGAGSRVRAGSVVVEDIPDA